MAFHVQCENWLDIGQSAQKLHRFALNVLLLIVNPSLRTSRKFMQEVFRQQE